jgi:hypothetical protein
MQRTAAGQLIRFQATNSSPKFLSLPREEIATSRKPKSSRSPAAWRLGAVDARAENAGKSSIQKRTSLQHPQTSERLPTAFSQMAGIDHFWHFAAILPKSTRRLPLAAQNEIGIEGTLLYERYGQTKKAATEASSTKEANICKGL